MVVCCMLVFRRSEDINHGINIKQTNAFSDIFSSDFEIFKMLLCIFRLKAIFSTLFADF